MSSVISFNFGISQRDPRDGRVGENQRPAPRTVEALKHFTRGIAQRRVRRRIPWKARRDNQRRKRCIRVRRVVPIRLGHKNRRFRAPGGVLVFRVERRHGGVAHGHIEQREGARVFRQRISGGDADLSRNRVPHPYRRYGGIIARNVGTVLRPDGAVCRAHGLDLVVVPCVSGALERWWFIQLELGGASQPERLHVSPLIECSSRGSAARRVCHSPGLDDVGR